MIEREIAEFGRRMGMPAFSLSPAGLAALDVERLGRLHLELAENAGERELLVYLARAVPEYDVKAPRRVLERCHYRHADPMPLSGGCTRAILSFSPVSPNGRRRRRASKGPSSSSAASWIPSPKPDSATSVFFTGKGGQPCRASTFWILPSASRPSWRARRQRAAASPRRGPSPPMSCARPGLRNCIPRATRTTSWSRRSARMRATATSSARRCFPATSRDAWKP